MLIRPLKRSASTAPDGTPGKKLLSNNFVVRRHVSTRGRNVSLHTFFCLPVDTPLPAPLTRNHAADLTAFIEMYDTGVCIFRSGAASPFESRDEPLFFPLFQRLLPHTRRSLITRADENHARVSRSMTVLENNPWIGFALSQCGQFIFLPPHRPADVSPEPGKFC